MIVYVWLLLVTILIGMMAYQSYADHQELEELRAQQLRDTSKLYEIRLNTSRSLETAQEARDSVSKTSNHLEHMHEHIDKLRSDIHDIKAKKRSKKKS